jgi:chromate transporter
MRVEIRPLQLGLIFLRIGAVAFGGLGATLALIERELVHRRHVATKEEITEALTYTKLLPGSTVVQVVAYLGWRLGGWSASALATAFFLLPSVVLMLALAYGYSQVADAPTLVPMRRSVLAVVVGLLLVTLFNVAKSALGTPVTIAVAGCAFLLVAVLKIGAVWIVVAAGVFGMMAVRGQGR